MQNRSIRLSEHERATTRKTSIKSREIRYVMSRIGAFTPDSPANRRQRDGLYSTLHADRS